MSESWDDYAETWDDGAPVAYADAAVKSLREQADRHDVLLDGALILDFGCGTGLLTERLAPDAGHIVALDPSAGMIARLEEKIAAGLGHVDAVHGTLDEVMGTPFFAHPFDVIVASSVCAFLEDYPGTLGQLASLLAPGGIFVQWDWELDPSDEKPFGLTRDAISSALKSAGLAELHVGRGFEAPFEGMTMAPLMGVGRRT